MKEIVDSEFEELLINSLNEISELIYIHEGLQLVLKNRLSFENWFKIELTNLLMLKTVGKKLEIFVEKESDEKISKRGKSIDIAIYKNNKKYWGIELKVIITSYNVDNVISKQKRTPEMIDEMISDLNKSSNKDYPNLSCIGLAYPFPIDKNHRNYTDFMTNQNKLENCNGATLTKSPCRISDSFHSFYLILSRK